MRFAILIVVAVAIVAGATASYFHYQAWRDNRFDELIVEAADRHNVDPAVVKALIKVHRDLNYAAMAPEARGLMLVPPDVAQKYLDVHERETWRYVCLNRRFRNHDPAKPELYTAEVPADHKTIERPRCKVPGCGQPLVEELIDPATNIEVACWYLGRLYGPLRVACREPVPAHILVAAYRWVPVEEVSAFDPRQFNFTNEQKAFLAAFVTAYDKYARQFEKRARQAEGE